MGLGQEPSKTPSSWPQSFHGDSTASLLFQLYWTIISRKPAFCWIAQSLLTFLGEMKIRNHSSKGNSGLRLPSEGSMSWQHHLRCLSLQAVPDVGHTHDLNISLWATRCTCWISLAPWWVTRLAPHAASFPLPSLCCPYIPPVVQERLLQCPSFSAGSGSSAWSKVSGSLWQHRPDTCTWSPQSPDDLFHLPGSFVLCFILILRGISCVYRFSGSPGSVAGLNKPRDP